MSADHRLEDDLPGALISYFDARNAAFTAARKNLGLSELDARALLFVAEHPGTRPRALAEFLDITSAGVTTLVDRLVTHQAIRRDTHPEDRRGVVLNAIVDLTREPWSALKIFDERIAEAVSRTPEQAGLTVALHSVISEAGRLAS